MESNGWAVEATYHNTINNVASCDSSTFFGFMPNGGMAKAITKFRGTGGAKLTFGNCYSSGFVSVSINNIRIANAYASSMDVIKFNYRKDDVLTIKAHSVQGSAILSLFSLEITDWSKIVYLSNTNKVYFFYI